MREFKKGSLGLLVLHLLYESPGYGYDLCERLRARSEGTLTFEDGAIYPLLHALERDGLAEGYWEQAAPTSEPGQAERRGPRRRYYRLTPHGTEALRVAIQEWQVFTGAMGRVLGGEPLRAGEEGA